MVVAAWGLFGCTARDPASAQQVDAEPQSGPVAAIAVGEIVVLTDDATLYAERDDEVGMALVTSEGVERFGYAVEVVSVTETHIQVRTLGPDDPPTCVRGFEFGDDLDVRAWVERESLRELLAEPVRATFADGTELELRPGVPVLDRGHGELSVGSQVLFVELGEARVKASHVSEPITFDEQPSSLRDDGRLHYGERTLRSVAPFGRAKLVPDAELDDPDEVLYAFDNVCGRFVLRASRSLEIARTSKSGLYAMKGPKNAIPRMARNFDTDMALLGGLTASDAAKLPSLYGGAFEDDPDDAWAGDCETTGWSVASNVALTWADGRRAGVVRRGHLLPEDAHEDDTRVCFEVEGLSLCIDKNELGREVDPYCAMSRPKRVPRVHAAEPKVVGQGLDADIVRRVVRAHIGEIRTCYTKVLEPGRGDQPQGRVRIDFEIGATGKVVRSELGRSTLEADEASECMVAAVARWKFPKPRKGVSVEVTYPFVLAPG